MFKNRYYKYPMNVIRQKVTYKYTELGNYPLFIRNIVIVRYIEKNP